MNAARFRVNDTINDIGGDLLRDDDPVTDAILQSAWRWLQAMAYTAGVETYIKETLQPLQVSSGPANDPANQAFISWTGSGDGFVQSDTPALPADMIQPLSVWRRATGSAGTPNNALFMLMEQAQNGLPPYLDYNIYDWRDDGLFFYAPTYAQDIRIRYAAYRAPLQLLVTGAVVPMMMCEDCLAARVAFEYASQRGAVAAPTMKAWADEAFQVIASKSSRRTQRRTVRRRPYTSRVDEAAYSGWPTARNF